MVITIPGMRAFVDANPHLCETVDYRDCNCVIDGSNFAHRLWYASGDNHALSDVPAFSMVVRNFFTTLLEANIVPHVCFCGLGEDELSHSGAYLADVALKRMRAVKKLASRDTDHPWQLFSMHGRVVFGEIIAELGIDSCQPLLAGYSDCARRLDAFVMSQNSSNFFKPIPRGFVNTDWLNLKNPSCAMKTFYRERLCKAIGVNEKGALFYTERRYNEKILEMFIWMARDVSKDTPLGTVVRKYCHFSRWNHVVNLNRHFYHANYMKYLGILNMLASSSAGEALRFMSASFFPTSTVLYSTGKVMPVRDHILYRFNKFEKFMSILLNVEDSPCAATTNSFLLFFGGWLEVSTSRDNLIASLSDLLFYPSSEISSEDDEISSEDDEISSEDDEISSEAYEISSEDDEISSEDHETPSKTNDTMLDRNTASSTSIADNDCSIKASSGAGDASEDNKISMDESDYKPMNSGLQKFPRWFLDIVNRELRNGESGLKLLPLIQVVTKRFFPTPYFLQDPGKLSSSFAGLHIRKALYGVLLHDYRAQQPNHDVYVQEIVNRDGLEELFESRVHPSWSLVDLDDPFVPIELPGLQEMATLELDARQKLFAIALVGRASWMTELLEQFSPSLPMDDHSMASIYRLLVVKAWAMRSADVCKLHVILLLLSVLIVEERLRQPSGMFPWPVTLKDYCELKRVVIRPKPDIQLNLKLLHPFAQLQSVAVEGRHLNAALNHPYGARGIFRVDRIQMFLSEKVFYNLVELVEPKSPVEAGEYVSGFFNKSSYANFVRAVDTIFDPKEAEGRQPLIVVPKSELGRVNFDYNIVTEIYREERLPSDLFETEDSRQFR